MAQVRLDTEKAKNATKALTLYFIGSASIRNLRLFNDP